MSKIEAFRAVLVAWETEKAVVNRYAKLTMLNETQENTRNANVSYVESQTDKAISDLADRLNEL